MDMTQSDCKSGIINQHIHIFPFSGKFFTGLLNCLLIPDIKVQ